MSLLEIVTNVCEELSLVVPTAVISSTDRQVVQLKALANRAGKELAGDFAWQAIREEFNFTTIAQEEQAAGAIPDDFDRWVANSFFDRTTRRPVLGPLTPAQYQWIKAQPVFASVYLAWIERGSQLLMQPTPSAGDEIYGEYVSTNWVQAANGGAFKSSFTDDTDEPLLDADLIELSIIWRFKQRKGLDYAEDMETFERARDRKMARDGGSTAINITPEPLNPARANLPDGNFPSAT